MKPTLFLFLTALTILVCGCSTGPQSTATASDPKPAQHVITRGMTADEVRKLVGEPAEIKKVAETPGTEIWIYTRRISINTQLNAVTTHQVPTTSPMTGTYYIPEPDFHVENTEVEEITELLFYNAQLLEWKHHTRDSSSYN
jgi:hypothetical protein